MKVCNKCGLPKEDKEFVFKRKEKRERRNTCRDCCKEYGKLHYQKNKATYIHRAKIFNKHQAERNQQNLFDYLKSKKCVDCGNDDIRVLEFDHKEGLDKIDNIGNMIYRYSWKAVLKEIGKCEIRCANCHRIKTVIEFDYFKNKAFKPVTV
jgi:hypothetical protein